MKIKIKKAIIENRKKYRIQGGQNYQLRSLNAIYISPSNSVKHELAKALGAYMIRKYGDIKFTDYIIESLDQIELDVKMAMEGFAKEKDSFITEAVIKSQPDRRVDLVRLSDNTRFEFECSKKIKKEDCVTIYLE